MGIKAIDTLQKQVEELQERLEASKTEAEKKVEELQKEFESKLETRKTSFEDEAPSQDAVAKAKKQGATLYLKSVLAGRSMDSFAEYKDVANIIEKAIKPADVASWLAEEFSSRVLEELELSLKVEGLFNHVRMPDGRNTFSIPGKSGKAQAYLIAPGDDAIESAIASAKVSFATQRIKTLIGLTDQADLETVTAIVDLIRQELVMSLARASEHSILRGDVTIADPNDVRKAYDGLLKFARTSGQTVDNGGGAITAANIAAARRKLGAYGLMVSDLVVLAPVSVAYQMIELDEVTTIDKYGANATILKGEIARIWGMPIVVSEYIPDTLETDGSDTGAGSTTAVLIVNKNYYAVADRGNIGIETERKAVSSTTLYVGYRDIDFKNIAINANPVAAVLNVSPA